MRLTAALLSTLLATAACGELDQAPVQPRAAPQITPRPAPTPMARTPAEPVRPAETDRCEAAAHAYLVGRKRTEIPVPVDPSKRRVTCTTCPVTRDLRPDRLNIVYDDKTGVITDVHCG